HHPEVGAEGQELGPPPQAARSHARAGGKGFERAAGRGAEGGARIFPLQDRPEDEAVRQLRGHVLERVDRQIGPAAEERLLDLLDEEALAPDPRQGRVEDAIALGDQGKELDLPAEGFEGAGDETRLPERQGALAGGDDQRFHDFPLPVNASRRGRMAGAPSPSVASSACGAFAGWAGATTGAAWCSGASSASSSEARPKRVVAAARSAPSSSSPASRMRRVGTWRSLLAMALPRAS